MCAFIYLFDKNRTRGTKILSYSIQESTNSSEI